MNKRLQPLTFEQEMQLRRFYELKSKRTQKRIKWYLDNFAEAMKSVGRFILFGINIFIKIFISSLVGIASKPIIYALNKPRGLGYANWGSYAVAGVVMWLSIIWETKDEVCK